MQDSHSGQMMDLSKFLNSDFKILEGREQRLAIEQACQQAQPDPARRGPVFMVGETLEIRGGRFAVESINATFIKLRSLPK